MFCLSSCSLGDTGLEISIPEGISHISVLELNDQGEILRAGSLRKLKAGTPVGIAFDPGAIVAVVGYSPEQLAPYGPETRPEAFERSRLRQAIGCEPRLPSPAWLETRAGPDGAPVRIEALEATADFMEGVCPSLANIDVDIDRRCARSACEVVQRPSGPCQVELDLSACGLAPAVITVDALGSSCVEWGDNEPLCQVSPGLAPAVETLECEGDDTCESDLYVTIDQAAAPFEVEKLRLFDAPPFLHSTLGQSLVPVPRARLRFSGYAFDLVVLGSRVLVVTTNDTRAEQECKNQRPRHLHAFDTERFVHVETTTVPPCLTQMVRDPLGSGFLATFKADDAWQVGRFDPRGRLLQASKVDDRVEVGPDEPVAIGFEVFEPAEIALVDDSTKFAVLLNRRVEFDMIHPRSIVVVHDVRTTRAIVRHDLPGLEDPRAMTAVGSDLVLASQFTHRLLWMDAMSGLEENSLTFGEDSLALSGFATLFASSDGSPLLVSRTGIEGAIFALPTRQAAERMTPYDRPLDAFALIPWPADPKRLLVGGISLAPDTTWVALVGFLEPGARRYWPDSWVIGDGILSKLVADDSGHVFGLLPWEASLVRFTPAELR